MKTHPKLRNGRSRGNVMVLAMLILAAGTVGLSAWTSLVVGRSMVVDAAETSLDRRVRLENSRQVAREWVYRKLVGESAGSSVTESLPDGWGQVVAPLFGVSYLGTETQAPFNRTSPMDEGAFGASIDVGISDGVAENTGRFFINSSHPAMAGDLLVVHNAPDGFTEPTVSGDLRVKGRVVLMDSENLSHGFKAERVVFPMAAGTVPTMSNLAGEALLPDNYPFTPLTTGKVGGAPDWTGRLNVVYNSDNTENSVYHKVTSDVYTAIDGSVAQGDDTSSVYVPGDGSAQIVVGSTNLQNIVVGQNVTSLILKGQETATEISDAEAQPPVMIVVLDPAVTTITCKNENYRRMVFAIKGNSYFSNVAMNFEGTLGFPKWRMIMEVENVLIQATVVSPSAQMTVVGGIRTNAGFTVGAGNGPVYLEEDSEPATLPDVLTRHGWAESFVQPGS